MAFYGRGQPEEALEFLQQALTLAQELNNTESISLILCDIARAEYLQGNYPQSEQRLAEAAKLAQKIQNAEAIIRTNHHLGVVATYQNKTDEALDFLTVALTLAQEAQIPWNEIDALLQIGELHLCQQDWQQANHYFAQAHQQAQALHSQGQVAKAGYGLARTLLGLGRIDEAVLLAQDSLRFFEHIKHYWRHDIQEWLKQL